MKKKKGVALALALWASLAVMLIGTIFLNLSITQSRITRDQLESVQAREFATAGLQYVMNLMSAPANWETVGGVEILRQDIVSWGGVSLQIERDDLTNLINTAGLIQGFSGEFPGSWKIKVTPVTGTGVAQPVSYYVEVKAEIYKNTAEVTAGRQIAARVRDISPLDYALFIQNYRAWDAPGVPPPNTTLGTTDCVGFTDTFQVKGSVRVDGAEAGDPSPDTAGNLNIWGGKARFYGSTSIQKQNNVYFTQDQKQIADLEKQMFPKGLSRGEASMGLPDIGGYLTLAAGAPGQAEQLSQKNGSPGKIVINDSEITYDANNPTVPNIPTVRLTVDEGTVYIDKLRKDANGQLVSYAPQTSFPISQLSERVLYVQGGNVQVQGNLNGAQLTVVADENVNRGIYNTGVWTKPPEHVEYEGNVSIIEDVTYTEGTASSLGIISKNHIFLNDYSFNSGNPTSNPLEVQAALMSYAHSVQFDWNNFACNPLGGANLNDPNVRANYKNLYKNGLFKFSGSIISKFADVEADVYGRGYTTQQLSHDDNMRNLLPPHFPKWSKANRTKSNPIKLIILTYEDKGSLKVRLSPSPVSSPSK